MSTRRYDIEAPVADTVASYLQGRMTDQDQGVSPVVTYFDPMSVDEANRIVVEVPQAQTKAELPGNWDVVVQVTAKSQWAQATVQTDMAAHWERVNEVRDSLFSSTLAADLNANAEAVGFGFVFIFPSKSVRTEIREDGWIFSELRLQMQVYTKS